MNKLPFRAFHEQHFSENQVASWKHMLNLQSHSYPEHAYPATDTPTATDPVYEEQEESNELTSEAIAIFEFSEAYRKEREMAAASLVVSLEDDKEPAANRLVLDRPPSGSGEMSCLEHMLNSAYLESCKGEVALWPNVPLRF